RSKGGPGPASPRSRGDRTRPRAVLRGTPSSSSSGQASAEGAPSIHGHFQAKTLRAPAIRLTLRGMALRRPPLALVLLGDRLVAGAVRGSRLETFRVDSEQPATTLRA